MVTQREQMDIVFTAGSFLRELEPLAHVAGRKHVIECLRYIVIDAHEAQTTIRATDLDVHLRTTVAATVDAPGVVLVPGLALKNLLSLLPAEATVRLVADEKVASITSDDHCTRLPVLPVSEFPVWPDDSPELVAISPTDVLFLLARFVAPAIPLQQRYTAPPAAEMRIENGVLCLSSTDGHRIHIARHRVSDGDALPPVLITRVALVESAGFFDDSDTISLGATDRHIHVLTSARQFLARRIEGKFPSVELTIQRTLATYLTVVIDREPLMLAVKRIALVLEPDKEGALHGIWIDVSRDHVKVRAGGRQTGTSEESIRADVQGESLSIKVQSRYLLDFLNAAGSSAIRIEITDPLSPAMFTPIGGDDELQCVIALMSPRGIPDVHPWPLDD